MTTKKQTILLSPRLIILAILDAGEQPFAVIKPTMRELLCDPHYDRDSNVISVHLCGLRRKGLITRGSGGVWSITRAGRDIVKRAREQLQGQVVPKERA